MLNLKSDCSEKEKRKASKKCKEKKRNICSGILQLIPK